MSIPQIFTATLSYLLDSGLYYSSNSMNFYCFKIMMTKMAFKNAILLRHVFQEFNRHDRPSFEPRSSSLLYKIRNVHKELIKVAVTI